MYVINIYYMYIVTTFIYVNIYLMIPAFFNSYIYIYILLVLSNILLL